MAKLELYCDGGCRGNQGKINTGGWGAYLVWGDSIKQLRGGETNTTNNKMELLACIEGLRAVKNKEVPIDVYVDSAYVHSGITQWIYGWMKKGWVNSKREPVANKDLWVALLAERDKFSQITFNKVKGHADNVGNIKADELANLAMDDLMAR